MNGEEIAQMSINRLKTNVFFSIDDTSDFNLQNYQKQLRLYIKQNGELLLVQDIAIGFISSHLYLFMLSTFLCQLTICCIHGDRYSTYCTAQVCDNDDLHHNNGDTDLLSIDVFIGI